MVSVSLNIFGFDHASIGFWILGDLHAAASTLSIKKVEFAPTY